MSNIHLNNLFPVPVMRVEAFLNEARIDTLVSNLRETHQQANARSELLSHTDVIHPSSHPLFQNLTEEIQVYLRDFGFLLFGENLTWHIKEMWMNFLSQGGHQAMHSHANSFISGVFYLTDCHPSAKTVFHNTMGARQFVFSNHHEESASTPYNSDRWIASDMQCGDLLLFPSYMLHAVPKNEGAERITVAFNALPERLRSWDYEISFKAGC